jgi:hypothetical protein
VTPGTDRDPNGYSLALDGGASKLQLHFLAVSFPTMKAASLTVQARFKSPEETVSTAAPLAFWQVSGNEGHTCGFRQLSAGDLHTCGRPLVGWPTATVGKEQASWATEPQRGSG